MKKLMTIMLALALLLPSASVAEDTAPVPVPATRTANGMVEAVDTYDIMAPFTGTLNPFTLTMGNEVQQGDVLFTLDTTKVYAPESGTVTLFAAPGDIAGDVQSRYGVLASIERENRFSLNATTSGANNKLEYKDVHPGEILYFKQTTDGDVTGEGRVIAVDGSAYTVEIDDDDRYEIGKRAKLYRKDDYKSSSCVGEGAFARMPEAPVTATGRIVSVAVQDGQTVQKGDLLLEVVSADADAGLASTEVKATVAGVLDAPAVGSGQQVYKGQLLATLHDSSALKVVAEVDEVDLSRVALGDEVSMEFDGFPGEVVTGVVTRISAMGVSKQNATYYDVDISFSTARDVRLYMNATVTLP